MNEFWGNRASLKVIHYLVLQELEEQLQKNGISVPPSSQALPPIPSLTLTTQRPIKQEPFDDISPSSSHTPTGSIVGSVNYLVSLNLFIIRKLHFKPVEYIF